MKRIISLRDSLIEELESLLIAEDQMHAVLTKVAGISRSTSLEVLLEDHKKITKVHADRLVNMLGILGLRPKHATSAVIDELNAEGMGLIEAAEEGMGRDDVIIGVVQKMKGAGILKYQTACDHAIELNYIRVLQLLNRSLIENRAMNLQLNELEQYLITIQTIYSL